MKKKLIGSGLILMFVFAPAAHAAKPQKPLGMIRDGFVGIPVSIAKLLGGTFRLLGEAVMVPLKAA